MTNIELLLTVGITALVTAALRFIPFLLFSGQKSPPRFITWLSGQLPRAVMAMLVVYCLKDVEPLVAASVIPALAGVAATVALHVWKKQMMLSIAGGTIVYMLLIRIIV